MTTAARWQELTLVTLAVAAVMAGAASGVGAGSAPDTGAASAEDRLQHGTTDHPQFANGTVSEHRGDVAEVTVSFGEADAAHLHLGGPDAGYSFGATVVDDDGDGRAVVRLNTYTAGSDSGILAGVLSGSAHDVTESSLSGAPPVGEYAMGLAERSRAAARDDPDAVGTLVVRPPGNRSVDLWRTDAAVATFDDAAAVAAGIDDGSVFASELATANETVIAAVEAPGIEGALAAESGTTTERFRAALTSGDLVFEVRQTAETLPPSLAPKRLNVSRAVAAGDLRVLDGPGDTYYVAFASSSSFQRGDAESEPPEDGENFAVRVGIAEGSRVADEDETVAAEYAYRADTVALETGTAVLAAAPNQTVAGRTTATPGETVTVTVEGGAGDDRFSLRRAATVRTDGTFRAAFDLSNRSVGANLTVTAVGPAGERATAEGEVGAPPSFSIRSVAVSESVQGGTTASIGVVVANDGDVPGTVTVVVAVAGGPVATETVSVDADASDAVVLDVEVPDRPPGTYEVRVAAGNESTRTDVEVLDRPPTTPPPTDEVFTTAPEPTTRPPESETETETDPETVTGTTSAAGTDADGGLGGFTGGLGIAALLAALLWTRRRN